ncbi:Adenylylsulfate kinase [Prochlorococcus marinus str. MIT 9211]|uniref:Adenylyl-sulfate kinase n=2 Tax=Prochlorococcus marinus TaxID=1219 RepID=A9BD26_PROM4|nr:Adenylylsulfate kinase [Prochlorococcus marinus str. MIT 9211]
MIKFTNLMNKASAGGATSRSKNIVWHEASVTRADISRQRSHKSVILWFTGLSGSGKSTLANAVNAALFKKGFSTYVLDGDNVRHGLCKDLGFSDVDREENIRRISEVAKLFLDAGIIVLTAFVSPFRSDRNAARQLVDKGDFIEVFCSADLKTCEERDTKGLYAKARKGEIKDFTGISSPYEEPDSPELNIETGSRDLDKCVQDVLCKLSELNIIEE